MHFPAWNVSKYGVFLVRIFPYSVKIRKNMDQKNSAFGHLSRSASSLNISNEKVKVLLIWVFHSIFFIFCKQFWQFYLGKCLYYSSPLLSMFFKKFLWQSSSLMELHTGRKQMLYSEVIQVLRSVFDRDWNFW